MELKKKNASIQNQIYFIWKLAHSIDWIWENSQIYWELENSKYCSKNVLHWFFDLLLNSKLMSFCTFFKQTYSSIDIESDFFDEIFQNLSLPCPKNTKWSKKNFCCIMYWLILNTRYRYIPTEISFICLCSSLKSKFYMCI